MMKKNVSFLLIASLFSILVTGWGLLSADEDRSSGAAVSRGMDKENQVFYIQIVEEAESELTDHPYLYLIKGYNKGGYERSVDLKLEEPLAGRIYQVDTKGGYSSPDLKEVSESELPEKIKEILKID
jgi:uncharacterized protein YxeA